MVHYSTLVFQIHSFVFCKERDIETVREEKDPEFNGDSLRTNGKWSAPSQPYQLYGAIQMAIYFSCLLTTQSEEKQLPVIILSRDQLFITIIHLLSI